jgi:hypothetical protein
MTVTPGAAWAARAPHNRLPGRPFFAEAAPAAQRQHAAHRSGFLSSLFAQLNHPRALAQLYQVLGYMRATLNGSSSLIVASADREPIARCRRTLPPDPQPLRRLALDVQVLPHARRDDAGVTLCWRLSSAAARTFQVTKSAGACFAAVDPLPLRFLGMADPTPACRLTFSAMKAALAMVTPRLTVAIARRQAVKAAVLRCVRHRCRVTGHRSAAPSDM